MTKRKRLGWLRDPFERVKPKRKPLPSGHYPLSVTFGLGALVRGIGRLFGRVSQRREIRQRSREHEEFDRSRYEAQEDSWRYGQLVPVPQEEEG